jgi:DNA polymerase IV (archaeal DinB-like DNA polymerase)
MCKGHLPIESTGGTFSARRVAPGLVEGWAHVVLHVDMDAFYASVEVARRPELRGLPVIVGADPMGGRGRGVVTAASYEARKFGVRSAMPISQAWQRCPQGVFLQPDFEHYWKVSGHVMEALGRFADVLEVAGLDEAYLEVAGRVAREGDIEPLARAIQAAVREAEGLSCSVGAAQGKVTAKIASDLRKPGGVSVLAPSAARDALAPLPVRRIPGVGPKTEARMLALGWETIGQLAALPEAEVVQAFGDSGRYFRHIALGLDTSPAERWEGPPRSIGNESTFMEDVSDPEALRQEVRELAAHVAGRLQGEGLVARTVVLKVRFADFATHTRSQSLTYPFRSSPIVEGLALGELEPFLADGRAFRLLGVRVTGLEAARGQTTLDEWS